MGVRGREEWSPAQSGVKAYYTDALIKSVVLVHE